MLIPLDFTKHPFHLGEIRATPGAIYTLEQAGVKYTDLLMRHIGHDWGDVDKEQAAANERAVALETQVTSIYTLPTGAVIWVITDEFRQFTTVMLPNEY